MKVEEQVSCHLGSSVAGSWSVKMFSIKLGHLPAPMKAVPQLQVTGEDILFDDGIRTSG